MFEKKVKLKLTDFECNVLINGMNEFRNLLLSADIPTEDVDELLIKIIDQSEKLGEIYMSNITYRQVGDYLIPNIKLAEEDKQPIGKYGLMRKEFIYNNKRVYFNILLMNGELTKHLLSVQQEAEEMLDLLIAQMSKAEGVTEELKATDQMKWVGLKNNIRHSAEEIVLNEIVFA